MIHWNISENRKEYATLSDRPGSLRAKPGWFSDLITPYEGFAEGPPRPLGNIVKASAWRGYEFNLHLVFYRVEN